MKKPVKKKCMAVGGMVTPKKPMIMLDKKKPVAPTTAPAKGPMIMLEKKKPVVPTTRPKGPMIMRKE